MVRRPVPLPFDPHPMVAWAAHAGTAARTALRWAAHHTGLPVVVVAAIALVLSWRLAQRTARLAVEVALALALLLAATRLGWITW